MPMNNTIHEPEFVADAKNAAAYFVILCFVTGGLVFVLGGMVSPFFWNRVKERCIEISREDAEKGKGTYEANLKENLRTAKNMLAFWFILAWGFLVVAYWNGI